MLWAEDIPSIKVEDPKKKPAAVKIIAGRLLETSGLPPCISSWAHNPQNHVGIFLIHMQAFSELDLPAVSATLLRNLYFYQGQHFITIEGKEITASTRVKLSGNDRITISNGKEESYLLLLEGEPIGEPVVQYGPFVMTTENEIRETFSEYRNTQFGGWPWDRVDPVHNRTEGRIARYADGTIETP
jgi:hypothetical protein